MSHVLPFQWQRLKLHHTPVKPTHHYYYTCVSTFFSTLSFLKPNITFHKTSHLFLLFTHKSYMLQVKPFLCKPIRYFHFIYLYCIFIYMIYIYVSETQHIIISSIQAILCKKMYLSMMFLVVAMMWTRGFGFEKKRTEIPFSWEACWTFLWQIREGILSVCAEIWEIL